MTCAHRETIAELQEGVQDMEGRGRLPGGGGTLVSLEVCTRWTFVRWRIGVILLTKKYTVSGRKPLASWESALSVVGQKLGCGEGCKDEPPQEALLQRTFVPAGRPGE